LIEVLTDRQQRERKYYNEYITRQEIGKVPLDPVLGNEKRAWNSYWTVYQAALDFYQSPEQKLLDFGCGVGVASMRYAHIGYTVYGFDIAENNVTHCEKLSVHHGFQDKTHFSVQVAEELKYEDNTFDVVSGIDILHHIEIENAIKEAYRVLKPGGVAVFREWIEVPLFDSVRNTRLVRYFFPNDVSFDDHVTEDEKKLNGENVKSILSIFPNDPQIKRYYIFSRLRKIIPILYPEKPSLLEMFDQSMSNILPFMKNFGGEIVFILKK
jgi:ubiquinone/menaquinone biosynthesis C-methylase UbiE